LHLSWTEKDGPLIRQLVKRSFGTGLIETLGRQLQGNVQLTYAESGFAYTFDVPLPSLNVPTPA
jgi:two-component sensor histidine kinase